MFLCSTTELKDDFFEGFSNSIEGFFGLLDY